ncbi:MAG: MoaD/ThiS family protein [Anaerolineae bacterium]|nr:MAG: MoaD/ThiS family protein [Anaerolineae bacterium]
MNQITVLFFATMRDHTGVKRITLELPEGSTLADLKALIGEKYPRAQGALQATLASINREFAVDEDVIPDGAEVAFFPQVSGG